MNGNLFAPLGKLRYVWLGWNVCVDENFNSTQISSSLQQNVTAKCGFDEPKNIVTTTEKSTEVCERLETDLNSLKVQLRRTIETLSNKVHQKETEIANKNKENKILKKKIEKCENYHV